MPTIVLADDHQIFRQGLRLLLEAEPGFKLVGEAGDGGEALRLTERLQPDVLVTDLMMPGISGLEITRQVSQKARGTRVVILSMHDSEAYVLETLRNGALAYVLKECTADELVKAIREVMEGRRYLSARLSERALETYLNRKEDTSLDLYETLTTREREILHLAVEGYSNSQIAKRLFISPRTAETHRCNLMRKLGLHTQAALIRYAVQRGIVATERA